MLERFRLPVPLGGTSNHFPRAVLETLSGWDAFNVTEDADLGIRLARQGYRVRVLESTTWEEAPGTFRIWLGQRTRWLKGWMQTYLVHMRVPSQLWRELGFRGFIGLQVLMGCVLLSVIVHPLFYILALADLVTGAMFQPAATPAEQALWWIGIVNLLAGYAAGMALGGVAVALRGHGSLGLFVVAMPVYWLLISAAAYRAVLQLVVEPFYWEKTSHSARSNVAQSVPNKR